jgi:hypothetical protein
LAELERGVSGGIWDIGQVLEENFDWLPFTPPLVAFSGPLKSEIVLIAVMDLICQRF